MSLSHATSSRIMSSEGIMIYHIIYGLLPLIPKHPKLEVDGETVVCTAPSLDRIPKLWLGTPTSLVVEAPGFFRTMNPSNNPAVES